ncbi:MAG: DUF5317 domain-containing protein [Solirubrobacteraceae bacterium]
MILIALAALCVLSVPLTGGRLSRLADIRIRGAWIPVLALTVQVVIVTIAPGGSQSLHRALHIATYGLIGLFLWANRRLPGVPVIATGALLNALAIVANGGVMPASETAERIAGLLHTGAGFHNSSALAHPVLLWLGDIIPWPGPLSNMLSIGDVLIYAGTLVLVHRVCRPRGQRAGKAPRADTAPRGA